MKTCAKCGQEKPIDRFVKSKACRGGRAGTCRDCCNANGRAWKAENRGRLARARREQYAVRYGPIQRQKERQRADRFPVRRRAQILRSSMSQRACRLGLAFDAGFFSVSRLMGWLGNGPTCECCARPLDVGFKHDAKSHDDSPSMDRFVPALGYVEGNVALVCWRCNNLKRDASVDELERVVSWMRRKLELALPAPEAP